jgi:hypothetical protein
LILRLRRQNLTLSAVRFCIDGQGGYDKRERIRSSLERRHESIIGSYEGVKSHRPTDNFYQPY